MKKSIQRVAALLLSVLLLLCCFTPAGLAAVQMPAGFSEQQVEALRLLATLKPDNVTQAEMIVRDMMSTGTTEGRMESLFGAEDYAGSIVLERAKIADEAMKTYNVSQLLVCGGVACSSFLRRYCEGKGYLFGRSDLCADNAAGVALTRGRDPWR